MTDLAALAGQLMDKYCLTGNAAVTTGVPQVQLFRHDGPVPRGPLLYNSGIFFLVSGAKLVHLGGRSIRYNPDNYLALGLPLAVECETAPGAETPLFAVYVAVDPVVLRNVAGAMGMEIDRGDPQDVPLAAAPIDTEMRDVFVRLMRILCSEGDTAVLGDSAVREIIYRALQGPAGGALRGLLTLDGHTSRIARVMEALQLRYADRFSVDDMAQLAGMSSSVFHRAFRDVAHDTPLQYLKKVRLTRASSLIAHDDFRVGVAAAAVGYESAAQFSRDFKSHFGVSPADARKLGYSFIGS